ncbi:hypothetical protein LXL04_002390 [Taraxacum kok-saghyz]
MNDPSSFLHEYPSHHVHTICNNGGADQSSNDNQSVSNVVANGYPSHQEMSTVHLNLSISEPLIRSQNYVNHQEQEVILPQPKLKASNHHALFLRVGSWTWTSKNRGDLVVKFYYAKKKMVCEFLFGSMKRKMEIRWAQVSAINTTMEEDKNCCLEIELEEPPEYFEEGEFRPRKQTQWERSDDFTQGQAPRYRRHTILFSPGVLEEPLKNLLQQDNRLYNLYQQPFPIHNSPFFDIPSFQFSYNNGASGSSFVPHSNYVQNNIVQPFVAHNAPMSDLVTFPNSYEIPYVNEKAANGVLEQSGINNHLVQPFVAHNAPMPDLVTFPNSYEIPYVNEQAANGVWEQNRRNNQIQDIHLPPITEVDYDPFEGLEAIISDEQLELLNSFDFDSICNDTLEENHTNNFNPFVDGARSYNGGVNVMNDGIDGDDDVFSLAQQLVNEEFTFLEPCYWPSFKCSMHDYKNGGGNGGSST